MAKKTVQKANADLSDTLGVKLDVPGKDLATVTRKAGRMLPRRLRREAAYLIEAEQLADHPKLQAFVDPVRAKRAERQLRDYVRDKDPDQERWNRFWNQLAVIVFNLLLFFTLLVVFLNWRGFIGPG